MTEPLIENIYYMLAYAYRALRHDLYKDVATESFDNLYDLFASILSKGIIAQVKRGLYREYREEAEALPALRGRIDMNESIKLITRRTNKLRCVYDELSENIYMNRLLKTTALFLLQKADIKRENRAALKNGVKYFSEIDCLDPIAVASTRLGLAYHRNNAAYEMLMDMCYLILRELLLTQKDGDTSLARFLDDQTLARLYERFLLEYYKKHHSRYHPVSKEISWDISGACLPYLPAMRSDVFLSDGTDSEAKKLIIEAKYYRKILTSYYDRESVRSAHLYQIYAYVKNEDKRRSGNVSGLLLYAKTEDCPFDELDFVIGDNRIGVKTLDLNRRFSEIKARLDAVIDEWRG